MKLELSGDELFEVLTRHAARSAHLNGDVHAHVMLLTAIKKPGELPGVVIEVFPGHKADCEWCASQRAAEVVEGSGDG